MHSEVDHKNTVCVASRKDISLLGVGGHFLKYPTLNLLRRSWPKAGVGPLYNSSGRTTRVLFYVTNKDFSSSLRQISEIQHAEDKKRIDLQNKI